MWRIFTHSEAGGHVTNEDAFEVRRHPADEGVWLCALADGQGGRAGGARAARLACRAAADAAEQYKPEVLTSAAPWVAALSQADRAVAADAEAGLTTLIVFGLTGDRISGASCGDSAVIALSQEGTPHELTRFQAKNPPVGFGDAAATPFGATLSMPGLVMAMSDGVWKYAGLDRIGELVSRLRGMTLIDAMQQAARLSRTGALQDDFTVVLFQDDN
jgi:serine/threonine protein phosphatase PrpC